MRPEARPVRWLGSSSLVDAHAQALALLLVALTAGTLLPRLGADGPPFPNPPRVEVGGSGSPRRLPEVPAAVPSRVKPAPPAALDLNTSDAQALQALPGVGPVLAERIVAYRTAYGPFKAAEDILQVPGIGPKRWERLRGLVRIGGGE